MKSRRVGRHSVAGLAVLALATVILPASGWAEVTAAPGKEVFVINDSANPVPMRPPALEVVQTINFGTFPSGSRFTGPIDLFTVPDGKTLVIQTVNISSNFASADEKLLHVIFSVDVFSISVQPVAEGIFSGTGVNIFRKSESVTFYAGPGTTVSAAGTRDGTNINFNDSLLVGIAGYLVDAPR
jgi:hypothetical protein